MNLAQLSLTMTQVDAQKSEEIRLLQIDYNMIYKVSDSDIALESSCFFNQSFLTITLNTLDF